MKSSMFGLGEFDVGPRPIVSSVSTPSKSHVKTLLVLVKKYIQIHERELEWTSTSTKATPISVNGAVSRQFSSFCLILSITRPQWLWNLKWAKKLHVNDKIRDPRQTNMSPEHYFWSSTRINFEKLLGWTVFKNPNVNPFQSSSVLPIRVMSCYVILTFL